MPSDELEMINDLLRSEDLGSMTLAQQRAAFESAAGSAPDGTTIDLVTTNGVTSEWVTAAGVAVESVILSLRGGGYSLGSLSSNRSFSALLSQTTSTRVLNVGYRNAPEAPFPAALDDVVAAYRWVLDRGTDPSDIAVVGNSAGGGLALALLLALRDGGDPLPACAAVVSPWTDLALSGSSLNTNASTEVMLDPEGIAETASLYVDDRHLTDPYVSPLYGDLTGLPPILIHVSAAEILRDDSTRFAEKARGCGVDVDLTVVDQMPHVWHLFAGFLPEADEAMAALGEWITNRLRNTDHR